MLFGNGEMASAQLDGKSYSVFVYDPRHTIDGSMFGILGRFIGLMIFHPDQYFDHLKCDIVAYAQCDGTTAFSTTDWLNFPDRITRLVWKCSVCGEFRFCHIWVKKEDYNEEEKKKRMVMIPLLEHFMSQKLQDDQFETNIHFIVKAFVIYIYNFFICHNVNPIEKDYFKGLAGDTPIILIQ